MNFTSFTAAALLAGVGASAFADVGPGPLGPVGNARVSISDIVPMGIFQDVYSFTLVDPGMLSGDAVAMNFGGYNILGLTVTLQDSSFAMVGSDSTPATGFTFSSLAAGAYSLNVSGYATGSTGGSYSGRFFGVTAPVPEPETYAFLLVGLGVVGFLAPRRRPQA